MEWIKGDRILWDVFIETYSPLMYSLIKKELGDNQTSSADEVLVYISKKLVENDFSLLRGLKGYHESQCLLYLKSLVERETKQYLEDYNGSA